MSNNIGVGAIIFLSLVVARSMPCVTFNRTSLMNHSLLYFNELGDSDDGSDSIRGHTGSGGRGEWFFPNGTSVSLNTGSNIYQFYDNVTGILDLRVSSASEPEPSGMYYFISSNRNCLFYVGLYEKSKVYLEMTVLSGFITSRGGPATTVVWKRFSVILTEGYSSMLVNASTAKYNHTLSDDFGGIYQCTVSNRVTEQTKEMRISNGASGPSNFRAVQTGLASIEVSWTISLSMDDQYMIFYNDLDGHYGNISLSDSNVTISGLNSGNIYSIYGIITSKDRLPTASITKNRIVSLCFINATVITANSTAITISITVRGLLDFQIKIELYGSSDCSLDKTRTLTMNKTDLVIGSLRSGTLYNISITEEKTDFCQGVEITAATAPSGVPVINFIASVKSSTSVMLKWERVPCEQYISGYILYQNSSIIKMLGSDSLQFFVDNLVAATSYVFEISAHNSVGKSLNATTEITTLVKVPILSVMTISSTSAFVSWTSAGNHVWYNLTWTRDTSFSCPGVRQNSSIGFLQSSKLNHTLNGLQGNSVYDIMITAWNDISNKDSSISFTTEVSRPSQPPSNVMVISTSFSITVSWSPINCTHENGPLTGYEVTYKKLLEENENCQNTTSSSTTLSQLTPSTNYSIKVAAMNSAGTGTYSDLVYIETEGITLNKVIGYTFIAFGWDNSDIVINSTIRYFNINNTDCFDNVPETKYTNQTHYNLTELEEGTQYNITFITFFTDGSVNQDFNATTLLSAPTGSPQSVTAMVRSSTSYDIQWDPVNCSDRNGAVIGYLLIYSTVEGYFQHQTNVTNGLMHRLENLNRTTVYTVEISARNAAGFGMFSKAITFKTTESTFLSLNGSVISNNSYVNIDDIGSTYKFALLCHTEYYEGQGEHSGGYWYDPDGVSVSGRVEARVPGFRRNRAKMVVRLLRNFSDERTLKEGTYTCNINASEANISTLKVRLFLNYPGNVTVSQIIFTERSSLTGSITQFMLTCTSMGGIPANVTWMRNGMILTTDTHQVSSSRTYNYSIEVEGRDEGLYTCLVRGLYNSDSVNITVKAPSIPTGVDVVQTGFKTLMVSWIPGEDLVTGYLVSYRLRENPTATMETSTSPIILHGLIMGENYSISIIATSNTLSSYPTNITAYIGQTMMSVSHTPTPVAGDPVNLTCSLILPEALKNAMPKIVWKFKGNATGGFTKNVSSINISRFATLSKVSTSEAGVYACVATLNDSINKSTTLNITIPVPTPKVVLSSRGSATIAGSSSTFMCNYSLSQYADRNAVNETITWKINKTAISEHLKNNTISYNSVATKFAGRYTCRLNITSTADYINVEDSKQSDEYLLIIQIPRPEVSIAIQPTGKLYPGTNITITCNVIISNVVNNNELVTVEWLGLNGITNTKYYPLKKSNNVYTSTLTINPLTEQDAGVITCVGTVIGGTVANNTRTISIVPESSITILEDKTESGTREVIIMWNISRNVVATQLNISYFNPDKSCLDDGGSFIHNETYGGNFTLSDLEEDMTYSVSISVVTGEHVIGRTTTTAITKPDVPSAAPTSFSVADVSSSIVELVWGPVMCIHQNGEITGYKLQYREQGNSTNNTIDISGENTADIAITGLKPVTTYEISIAAVNSRGIGKYATREIITQSSEGNSLDIIIFGPVVAGAVIGLLLLILVVVCICVLIRLYRKRISVLRVKTKPLFSPQVAMDTYWGHDDEGDDIDKKGIEMKSIGSTENPSPEESSNILVDQFPEYVRQMHENGDDKLKQQYTALGEMSLPSSEIAHHKSNLKHNRFRNIHPYDFNRVVLKEDDNGSDYINASFINGYNDAIKTFIAAQGPTDATVSRFLEMLWQYNIPTIVMLTRCVEDGKEKCEQYWSDQLETSLTKGKFSVTLKSYLPSAEYQIRKFQLTQCDEPEKEMCVTHMLYTAWPDHGVPHNAMSLISFIRRVRREHPASLSQPLLVHCSAGVGRTGTFILLDLAIQQIANEGSITVMSQLKKLRQQRMKLVQTQMQYNFIHDSLSELVFCGETEISAADITIAMSQLQRQVPGDVAAMTGLEKQFQCLVKLSSQNNALYQEAEAKYNAGKNRFPDILPNELHRVRLRYTQKKGSDYINASFVDGYKQRRAYIATQGPMASTVADFWRMVWEHNCSCIVMLCELYEGGQESSHCFWPQETSVMTDDTQPEEMYGKLKVTLKSCTPHGDIILRKLVIEEVEGKSLNSRVITLLQLSSWPPGELPHPTSILTLIDLLGVAQRSSASKHTVIMCSDGVGRTGTFISIHSQLERLKTEGVVDILQGIKSARIQRAGLVSDSVYYAFCHDVVATYLDSFDTYANFKEVV